MGMIQRTLTMIDISIWGRLAMERDSASEDTEAAPYPDVRCECSWNDCAEDFLNCFLLELYYGRLCSTNRAGIG
jgi:hypothetical protein